MSYINIKTKQYPISETDIRLANPNVSYPHPFPVPEGYAWVFSVPQPPFNGVIEKVQEGTPKLTTKGTWEQQWEVVSKFAEYVDHEGIKQTVSKQRAQAIADDTASRLKALQEDLTRGTQTRLDTFARSRGYSDILSLCTYATDSNPKFRAEGQCGVDARSSTWAKLYEVLEQVQQGTRPSPANFADIESELPPLMWP